MLKKLIAGGAVVFAALLYVVFGNRNSTAVGAATVAGAPAQTQFNTGSSNPPVSADNGSNTTAPNSSASTTTSQGQYKNGIYKGSVADATYGSVQAEAIISGGKLANVKLLQYPDGGGHTNEVNGFALPQLVQEAIVAQSAQVDIVSGATQTSMAFQESLGMALQQAQA